MREIDADALHKRIKAKNTSNAMMRVMKAECLAEIDDAPTIEPERKTGKWIGTEYDGYADGNPVYYEWKCSACGCVIEDDEPTWNFCPNCGADMRGEQNG